MNSERPNYIQTVTQFQNKFLKMDCSEFQIETREFLGKLLIKEFKHRTNTVVLSPYRKLLTNVCGE